MTDPVTTVEERALALRAEALLICDRFAWTPQCIGTGECEVGPREIYAELRCLQKVGAVFVSQALIECCLRHKQWLPLFEDVQARIWMFLGERERAEQRWRALLHHSNSVMREIAEMALKRLEKKIENGEDLAISVAHALDRNQTARVTDLLIEALLESKDLDESWLQRALEQTALKMPVPNEFPWDRTLFTNHLMLGLYAQQLEQWEQNIDD